LLSLGLAFLSSPFFYIHPFRLCTKYRLSNGNFFSINNQEIFRKSLFER
jgi:hypothetical protein